MLKIFGMVYDHLINEQALIQSEKDENKENYILKYKEIIDKSK